MTKSCKSPTPRRFSLSMNQKLENTFLRALEQNQQKLTKAQNRCSDYLLSWDRQSGRWLRYVYPALLVTSALLLLPLVIPVLPVEKYISYSGELGIKPGSSEKKELAELPQFYADMFGWKEKARDVAKVYETLSEEDKIKCAIYSNNYGRCGAIDFFGKEFGLPKSIGSHNNYWLWGPRNYTGEVTIILGGTMEDHRDDFASCELAGVSTCTYCMPYENNVGIFLCRGLKVPWKDIWKEVKHYE